MSVLFTRLKCRFYILELYSNGVKVNAKVLFSVIISLQFVLAVIYRSLQVHS